MNRFVVSLLIYLFFLPFVVRAQTKRALVIGLGEQLDTSWGKINGDKDVSYVVEMLRNAKFTQIRTCVNSQATKVGIISEFRKLSASCGSGDIVYIHFSGHGQQMKDTGNDEYDKLDECWIPYDAYRKPCEKDRGEKHLTDDEVNVLLTNIKRKIGNLGKMLVVIDACHSGDATRGDEGDVVRGVSEVFEVKKDCSSKTKVGKEIKPHVEHWITLSACESDQLNFEMRKPVVGKLTYALYKKIKVSTDNDNLFRNLRMFINMNTGSRPQIPTMTGDIRKYNIVDILK